MTNRIEGPKAEGAAPLPEGFITKEEVARRLRKSPRTIENWQRRGFVPVIKAGRASLYKWSDVEAHLQQHFRVCRLHSAGRAGSPLLAETHATKASLRGLSALPTDAGKPFGDVLENVPTQTAKRDALERVPTNKNEQQTKG